jgi:polyisoprenoid-binding protein YceI
MALEKWNFDTQHSSIGFKVRHMMVSKVRGRFTKWSGHLEIDEANPGASKIDVEIDMTSIDTQEPQRDAHLRTGDFFEVEKFPTITFKKTGAERVSGDKFKLTGDLTIRGVTKPITLEIEHNGRATHPQMGEKIGYSAHGSLSRKEFGLVYNMALEAGGVVISDNVDLELEIEATKA